MRQELCDCAELPRLKTQLKICVLVHPKEVLRPTNTGRLAHLCLENSEYIERTHGDLSSYEPDPFKRAENVWTLFPSEDSLAITDSQVQSELSRGPSTLIVPDASWKQASKMVNHIPSLHHSRKLKLPPSSFVSQYFLRRIDDLSRLSTLESIALALGFLEGEHVRDALLRAQGLMVIRTLKARGSFGRIVNEMTAPKL